MNSDMLTGVIIFLLIINAACLQVMFDWKRKYKNISRTVSNSGLWYDSAEDKLFVNDGEKKEEENLSG